MRIFCNFALKVDNIIFDNVSNVRFIVKFKNNEQLM